MSENTYYLTTPIYYVNARPHIGHAYTTIVADVLARRSRLLGNDTFFLTGTDEHGQKIERSAAAAGVPPQQFADEVSRSFEDLWKRMGITNDAFIRTTDERHKRGVQKLFTELYQRGFIYLASYTGQYCVPDEAFVDVEPGAPCPDCGRITETLTEENFFFKLSAFAERIAALIDSNELLITPDSRRNEVLSFVRGGLRDLSISRSSFTWGIPVPEAIQKAEGTKQNHVIYVWLDALANYMTAIGYGSDDPGDQAKFERYWPADLHLVGKEIIRFHCVYWPAFLLAAGLPLPKAITAHGWLLFEDSKMSKSKGNIVRTETILDGFGDEVYGKQFPESAKAERDLFAADVLRYFLLREIPFGQDGSFSFDALITRYNADLANGYGNLVSRTLNIIRQSFPLGFNAVPERPWLIEATADHNLQMEDVIQQRREEGINTSNAGALTSIGTQDAVGAVSALVATYTKRPLAIATIPLRLAIVDRYISANKPWALAKSNDEADKNKLLEVLYISAEAIRIITALLYPILPFATAKVWAQLGLGDIETAARSGELNNLEWGGLKPGTKLGPLAPIFPRADKGLAQMMIDMETSTARFTENAQRKAEIKQAKASSTAPGAPPRTTTLAEPAGPLPVGGSTAVTTGPPDVPSAAETKPSAPFDSIASQTPITAGPNDGSSQIGIDDFAKVELRVAQVLVAERIPKADKLLRLEVDLGYEKRQILSGIAEWYAPDDLVGRRIVVITNLAPRKMRGLESHGMLLAASNGEGGKPVLATFGEEIALGSRLK